MNEQELNRKLVEWAGFKIRKVKDKDSIWYNHEIYTDPNGNTTILTSPNFTQSLDACFKWLVPRMYRYWMTRTNNCKEHRFEFSWGDADGFVFYYAEAETPTLALCLAIEKLIDKEKKWMTKRL